MQIAATKNHVLVSGKAGVQVHNLDTGESTRTFLPGEAKTITPVNGTVYLGVYTLARLFTMLADGSSPQQVDEIGHEQTRPTDAVYDEQRGELLITSEPEYGRYEGAFSTYDVESGEIKAHRGVVPDQSIASVAVLDGVAYLGSHTRNSLGTEPIVEDATVSAFDLDSGEVLWEITPVEGADRISDLKAYRGRIYATTDDGDLLEIDPETGSVSSTVTVGPRQSTLAIARGVLYGTDGERVFRVAPSRHGDPSVTTVLDELNAATYSFPMIAAPPDGSALYTLRDRNLIRITGLPTARP
jgi:outer membrane protein assembly factor BamB